MTDDTVLPFSFPAVHAKKVTAAFDGPTASNWRSPKSNSRTPRKSNKGKAGNKRTRLATRTSTTIGRSDTIGLWNRRESSMFAWSPVLCRRDTAAVVQRSVPVLRYLEKVVHPRWHTPLKTTKRLVGTVVVILSTTLVFIPIPFKQRRPRLGDCLDLACLSRRGRRPALDPCN